MLILYTIYDHPKDFPDSFVIRRRYIGPGVIDLDPDYLIKANTLEEARSMIPAGLHRMVRHESDDPVIIESYI